MMSNSKIVYIVVGVILIIGLIMVLTLEIRDVPDYKWHSYYKYESNEPYDLQLFKSLIEEKYPVQEFILNKEDTVALVEGVGNLYISVGRTIDFDKEEKEAFIEFISQGNTAFLSATSFDIISEDYDTLIPDGIKTQYGNYVFSRDSSFCFDLDFISKDSTAYCCINYQGDTSKTRPFYYEYIVEDSLAQIDPLSYNDSWEMFYGKMDIGEGQVYLHSVPILFTNYYSLQDYYLPHFNKTFSYLPAPDRVILDKAKLRFDFERSRRDSPIDFVLKTPPLKWAYYLTIASLVCFVIFRGKRRQRIVPVKEKNVNTSMEYVNTLSELYKAQNQNNKLVNHMHKIFLHRMQKKYFVDPNGENFSTLLSKKSKVPQKDIDNLIYKFNSAQTSDFTDEQLIVLHKQIESFYKKAT